MTLAMDGYQPMVAGALYEAGWKVASVASATDCVGGVYTDLNGGGGGAANVQVPATTPGSRARTERGQLLRVGAIEWTGTLDVVTWDQGLIVFTLAEGERCDTAPEDPSCEPATGTLTLQGQFEDLGSVPGELATSITSWFTEEGEPMCRPVLVD